MLLIITLFSATLHAESITEHCKSAADSKAVFSGTLTKRTYPGRPNYESIENGDEAELVYVLRLLNKTCIMFEGHSSEYIDEVQVINHRVDISGFLSQDVSLHGESFEAHTGHHHTRVILSLSALPETFKSTSQ